jgi:hypothetical protein
MNQSPSDQALLAFVERSLNSGHPGPIRLPSSMLEAASDEALEAVRQLCRLSNVAVEVAIRTA